MKNHLLMISSFLITAFLISINPVQAASGTFYIRDDATGGSCTTIGTWDSGTKMCTLTTDITGSIEILSDNITLNGNGHVLDNGNGVYLANRKGVVIENLTLTRFYQGIILSSGSGNKIRNNIMDGGSQAIHLYGSSGNTITGNTIANSGNSATNSGGGILIQASSSDNRVEHNTLSSNCFGIYIASSSNNNIVRFNVVNSSGCIGVVVDAYCTNNEVSRNTVAHGQVGIVISYANETHVYNNNFIDNLLRPWNNQWQNYGNVFNLPAPIGGNYWSDFDSPGEGCSDANSDGFCDTPYTFLNNQDNLPHTQQIDWMNQPPVANAGGPYTGLSGASITLDASASSDPDGDVLTYEWDLNADGIYGDALGETATTAFNLVGEHTIGMRVVDLSGLTNTDTTTVTVWPEILHAVPGGLTSGVCESWANACELQYALTNSIAGQDIWVVAGVYKPTTGTNRTIAFQLKNGVEMYGGFTGMETARDQRDWQANLTILSGDIDNNDINDDGNFIAETWNDIQGYNSYHVVWNNNLNETAVLDGFVITAGQANGYYPYNNGAGMLNDYSDPTLTNLVISGNMAEQGGGMRNDHGNPTMTNISFVGNHVLAGGGGLANDYCQPILKNVMFVHNSAGGYGGGMVNDFSTPTFINITVYGNSASYGGGITNNNGSFPIITNAIIWGNSAVYAGNQIFNADHSTPSIAYSDIQGSHGSGLEWNSSLGTDMGNNIDVDPLFMDAPHGDLRLLIHSPAIDTGDDAACPVTDMFGILRPQGAHCDMGAFEFVIPPNHSPFITGITAPFAPVQVGQSINATVEFSDPDVGDTHTLALSWGDGSTTTASATVPSMSTSHTYTSPGVYTVTATITDAAGAFDTETFQYVVVYDPNGGFVTGGGWINSPEGAYTADPSLTGKATFGFVAKYQKGANVPTGQTEFQFHVANLNFKSTSFDWLVIAGSKAQFKGTGTINGAGEYGFMLTAIDGSPDKFRIKIWDKATGQVIYDNMLGAADDAIPSTVIEGGSMVIHKPK